MCEELGQIMVKQLKNRYADPGNYKTCLDWVPYKKFNAGGGSKMQRPPDVDFAVV